MDTNLMVPWKKSYLHDREKKKLNNNLFWVNNHEEIPYTILYLGWFGTFKIKILYMTLGFSWLYLS